MTTEGTEKQHTGGCAIVRDLLPIYIEGLVNGETAEFVEHHLSGCGDCRREADALRLQQHIRPEDDTPLRSLRRALLRRRLALIILTAGIVIILLLTAYFRLTKKHYLKYGDAVVYSGCQADELYFLFTDRVTGYDRRTEQVTDGGRTTVHHNIEAWYTLLDRLKGIDLPKKAEAGFVIPSGRRAELLAEAHQNADGSSASEADRLPGGFNMLSEVATDPAFGEAVTLSAGNVELQYDISPSASLLPFRFALSAAVIAAALAAAALVLRIMRRRSALSLAVRMLMLPLSCIAAYLLVNGTEVYSHTPGRDLTAAVLLAALIFTTAVSFTALWRRKRHEH